MKVIVHHSQDFDGYFSAVVTALRIMRTEQFKDTSKFCARANLADQVYDWMKDNIIFFPYNYQEEKPHQLLEDISEREDKIDEVYFVDCMFKDADVIEHLTKMEIAVTTLDHHESSFKWQEEFEKSKWPYANQLFCNVSINSSEQEEPISAAELCWEHHELEDNRYGIPRFLEYISAYDVWNKSRFPWKEETLAFQYGLRSVKEIDLDNPMTFFEADGVLLDLRCCLYTAIGVVQKNLECDFNEVDSRVCQDMIDKGQAILEFIASRNKSVASCGKEVGLVIYPKNGGEPVKFDHCFMAADYCNNSLLFEDYLQDIGDFDVLILAKPDVFDKEGKLSVSLVTSFWNDKHPTEVRSSGKLCELLGGGGHQGIGGCKVFYDVLTVKEEKPSSAAKTVIVMKPIV